MKKTKKKTRRGKAKYPALDPSLNLKTRTDLIDQDYIHKLSDKEKSWLNKFNEEYVNGTIDREDLSKNFHNTKALKKDCDDRNNARNRDILTRQKAANSINYFEDLSKDETGGTKTPEEEMIEEYETRLTNRVDKI